MNLKNAYLRVSVETGEQLSCCLKISDIDLLYLDAGYFPAEGWKDTVKQVHKGTGGIAKLAGLRFPHVFRTEAEEFFRRNKEYLVSAGFDCFLVRNAESALWLSEELASCTGEKLVFDHTMYSFNSVTDEQLSAVTGFGGFTGTYSLELSDREIRAVAGNSEIRKELVVYGRVPMMVTAQCIRRTSLRCDRRMCVMKLKDRTGAMMPLKNCCTFCYNTIYNSVPTCINDLCEDISAIAPDSIRYEFTVEKEQEIKDIFAGRTPANFTRGHFRHSVM